MGLKKIFHVETTESSFELMKQHWVLGQVIE